MMYCGLEQSQHLSLVNRQNGQTESRFMVQHHHHYSYLPGLHSFLLSNSKEGIFPVVGNNFFV